MNLFDEYKALFNGENINLSSPFMTNKLLSLSKDGYYISTQCNKYIGRIPKELLLVIYQSSLEKQKAPYIKYPKKLKQKEIKLIDKICELFNCNLFHSKQIIAIFRKKKINPANIFGLKNGE